MTLECAVCTADVIDALLCRSCTRELEQAIAELPALLHDLDVTIARQDRGTGAALYAMRKIRLQIPGLHYEEGTVTLPSTPWPFAWDAANLRWSVLNTISTWTRHILESRGLDTTDSRRPAPMFLLANLEAIRQDEAAAEIHDELVNCRHAILRAIDRQEPDVYAGRCDGPDVRVEANDATLTPVVGICGADLYGRQGDSEVKCQACGAVYDMATRKTEMLDEIPDLIASTAAIANGLTSLMQPVTPSMIRQMAHRNEIPQRGLDYDGRSALYRVGDVMDVLRRRGERKAEVSDRRRRVRP